MMSLCTCRWLSDYLFVCLSVRLFIPLKCVVKLSSVHFDWFHNLEYLHCAKLGLSTKTGLATVAGSSCNSCSSRLPRMRMLHWCMFLFLLFLLSLFDAGVELSALLMFSVCVFVSLSICCCNAPICKWWRRRREMFHIFKWVIDKCETFYMALSNIQMKLNTEFLQHVLATPKITTTNKHNNNNQQWQQWRATTTNSHRETASA